MSNKIKHSGIVEEIADGCMKVRIVQTSACAACKVASHCSASEKKEKIVDVYDFPSACKTGDTVTVVASSRVGMNAVLMGFGIPFLIMIFALYIASRFTSDEPLMALVSIVCLVPYYLLLYMFRDRIKEKFAFTVE
jgi:sigma-E factor negative regulatory protein RseC